jgi:hypothetical protein
MNEMNFTKLSSLIFNLLLKFEFSNNITFVANHDKIPQI